jgi:proline racemase
MRLESALRVSAVDYHTAGEPFRIVSEGLPPLPGTTVLDRRDNASTGRYDTLRQLLVNEPRGHADMYGGFVVPPNDDGADFGVLFWHKDGYSTACGHGAIALGAWAVDAGRVLAPDDGAATVVIDVPSGRVEAVVRRVHGKNASVTFRNVKSRSVATNLNVQVGRSAVTADIAFGGAIYAAVRAGDVGLRVVPDGLGDLIEAGRAVKAALAGHPLTLIDGEQRLSGLYGVIFYDELPPSAEHPDAVRQRNVTIFADGQVDRSPCGSGTSARLCSLHAKGEIAVGQMLEHESIVGSVFHASIASVDAGGDVETTISGTAHRTGTHEFVLAPEDELGLGFVLR